jgi:hypothetical protein
MVSRRAVLALVLVQLIAFAAAAQQSAEFGRATGGELVLTPKGSAPMSGSLGISLSDGTSPGYAVSAGGTLIQDRLWFFASGSRQQSSPAQFRQLALPEKTTASAIDASVNAQLTAKQDFSAFFETARRPELAPVFTGVLPSSFLSLHYNAVLSPNSIFSASMTRTSTTLPTVWR